MNVWILTAIRSGSTYLWRMMNETGLFGFPDPHSDHPSLRPQREVGEFLAPNHQVDPWDVLRVPRTREMAVQYLRMKSRLIGTRRNLLKVPMEQYDYYMLDHRDRPLVEGLFPGSRYIWLEREDLLARTVSAWFFFATKTAHLGDEAARQRYLREPVRFDANGILDVYYNHVRGCDWGPFLDGAPHLRVTYEELVARPADTLARCLDWLGLEADARGIAERHPRIRTERPETRACIVRLKKLLAGVI